ncbi:MULTISPECIES: energy transducer TonB [Thermodesulfovibrio]|jgi:colicin import membrane protein|uniref:energy transducer TonB n=1 Tax=Thermodesulfovibrio TaxID=28261 RepID=UPI00260EAD25|nr:energy transducer TonB [Thermodesulfovibrio sp.]
MTGKIYSSLFISILFHSLFILLLTLTLRNSTVDFKNTLDVTLINNIAPTTSINTVKESLERKIPPLVKSEKINERNNKTSQSNEKLLQERISALKAKKKIAESRISNQSKEGSLQIASSNASSPKVSSNYLGIISGLIRQNWNIPDTVPKNLEAVVSVRILPNGQIIIEGFEKNSGNMLFDASVIKALKNSSPLPPPKAEVVVGLRFKP